MVPNFFLGLMQVVAWMFWREPVAKAELPQPESPRVPTLGFNTGVIPSRLHSIVRLSWLKAGKTVEVDEFRIPESEQARDVFQYTVGQALRHGADVCVLTTYQPEELGVPVNDC